ncbi:MAG: hypothetical protein LCH58_13515 [Bacteroidetes bacterium]|uniref:hypothetical protein n=1 Tax=Phnomibacter sp. TaxID=2836217 RepID=UPI002FDEF151|nr:hypothetical protein [Bacteroidota bacterium]
MPVKVLRVGLLLAFLCLYLEWGKGQHAFVAQLEWQTITLQKDTVNTLMHPLVLLPFLGQLLMLYAVFASKPRRWQTRTSIVLMGTLAFMILLVGGLSLHWKVILSALPFWIIAVWLWQKE